MTPPPNLPADLTELDQWVLWRYEDRGGRRTKVPAQPTGKLASATDRRTWRPYSEVVALEGFAGIGFVFDAQDPYVGIDLDNCLDESGAIREWAIPYIAQFHDTYAEISPSGAGIKIFTRGKLPGRGKRKNWPDHAIEIYDQGRFFTVTGNAFAGAPLQTEEHQAEILALYASLEEPRNGTAPKPGEQIPEGSRHKHLVRLAGAMRRQGSTPEAIEAALVVANQQQCGGHYDRKHIHQIAESAEKWPVPQIAAAIPDLQPQTEPPAADNLLPAILFPLQQALDANDPARSYDPQLIRCAAAGSVQDQESAITKLKAKYGKDFNKTTWRKLLTQAEADLKRAPRGDGALAWELELLTSEKGNPLAATENALIAFRSAPDWQGVLNLDLSSFNIVVKCPPPWPDKRSVPFNWMDEDDTRATGWLERNGIMLKTGAVSQAIQTVARENGFHPIRDYLAGLEWDGKERINLWLEDYLGVRSAAGELEEAANELGYIRAVSAKFLIGAVARVMQPGCKHDTCLILEGAQGIKKSTALRTMFAPWFTDDCAEIGSKDASMQTRGVWLIEFGELDTFGKAEASRIKVFTSRAVDRFRPPYGRRVIEAPRESVFAGTVNQSTYLRDETGGRRFWPIICGSIDIPALERDRDQLWAEARARYGEPGATWWLEGAEVLLESARQQESRYEADPWQELIAPWLEAPAQRFLTQSQPVEPFTTTRDSTTALEILLHVIGKRASDITLADHARIGRSMRALRWSRRRVGSRADRDWRYVRPVVA